MNETAAEPSAPARRPFPFQGIDAPPTVFRGLRDGNRVSFASALTCFYQNKKQWDDEPLPERRKRQNIGVFNISATKY